MLTCRQNYAILTTDGYWNSDSGYTAVGNADVKTNKDVDGNAPQYPDTYTDTLADVAYQYWRTDLRTTMANNVLTSTSDPADWQHMVTFGVSIGLRGLHSIPTILRLRHGTRIRPLVAKAPSASTISGMLP